MIKAIIFDCFGVLTTDLWREFCETLPPKEAALARNLNHQYDAGQIDLATFLAEVHKATGRSFDMIKASRSSGLDKNTNLIKYIGDISKRYKIGILSNVATNWIKDELLNSEEQKLFDAMIFSFEAKITKPDPQIYQLAAADLGVMLQECVFIDDLQKHVDGAKAVGMQAILYKDFEQMKRELQELLK